MTTKTTPEDSLLANVRVLLDQCPDTIRCREGGGLEDETSSLVLTFTKMQSELSRLRAELASV
jgi:hypothetical protein